MSLVGRSRMGTKRRKTSFRLWWYFVLWIILGASGVFLQACDKPSTKERACEIPVSDSEAVSFAEEFIRVNGYTLHDPEPEKVSRDFMETGPLDQVLARRRYRLWSRVFPACFRAGDRSTKRFAYLTRTATF